ASTEVSTLALHDALPICGAANDARRPATRTPALAFCPDIIRARSHPARRTQPRPAEERPNRHPGRVYFRCTWQGTSREASRPFRSEEHTSELQSRENLVC